MGKKSDSIFKRILAALLCIAMLAPTALVPATATEVLEPVVEIGTEAEQTEITVSEGSEPEWVLPECDCGSTEGKLGEHGELCALRVFLEEFCEKTAAEIYSKWDNLPEECRNYILEFLGQDEANGEKLAELNGYLNAPAEDPEVPGEDPEAPVEDP